jgi:hypothetical protein
MPITAEIKDVYDGKISSKIFCSREAALDWIDYLMRYAHVETSAICDTWASLELSTTSIFIVFE